MARKTIHDNGFPSYHAPHLTLLTASLLASLSVAADSAFSAPNQPSGAAAVLPVANCLDDGNIGTLRSVVATAVSGDTVDLSQLDCGTITLVTGQIEVHISDLRLLGPGRDLLAIDGDYSGRVFSHDGGGTLTIQGLTITHGLADGDLDIPDPLRGGYGGCILSMSGGLNEPPGDGSVTLVDAAVTACRAVSDDGVLLTRGGGIFAAQSVALWSSTVSDNVLDAANPQDPGTWGTGGGFHAFYGTIEIRDSVISGNRVETLQGQASGGGFSSYSRALSELIPSVIVDNSSIVNNFAGCDPSTTTCETGMFAVSNGGGMNVGIRNVVISSSNVSHNELSSFQSSSGAGIFEYGGDLHVVDSVISDNHARVTSDTFLFGNGGGVLAGGCDNYLSSTRSIKVERSTIDGNSANYGGGIWNGPDCLLTVENSTLSGNTAHLGAGAIYNIGGPFSAGPMLISNNTITANISEGPLGAGGILDRHTAEELSVIRSSIIAGNLATAASASYDDDLGVSASGSPPIGRIIGTNNLINHAQGVELPPDTIGGDPLLGPLLDNGGRTPTHALLPGSPAIDAGNNDAGLAWDQRGPGYARVVDVAIDIGAYEFGAVYSDSIFADGFEVANPP